MVFSAGDEIPFIQEPETGFRDITENGTFKARAQSPPEQPQAVECGSLTLLQISQIPLLITNLLKICLSLLLAANKNTSHKKETDGPEC